MPTEFSTANWAEQVGAKVSAQVLAMEYEKAVKEQKKELKDSKNKAKSQEDLSQHITIEEIEEREILLKVRETGQSRLRPRRSTLPSFRYKQICNGT